MFSDAELNRPVSFPRWAEALASDPEVGPGRLDAFRRAIMGYLKHLKDRHERASLASAKAYFDEEKAAGRDREESREAVRWFFRAAKRGDAEGGVRREELGVGEGEGTPNAERRTPNSEVGNTGSRLVAPAVRVAGFGAGVEDVPAVIVPEKADLGATPWERKLVERLRVGHYQWRTETSYREWARRFCAWLGARPLEAAGDEDIKRFLTELAVNHRLSASTQRQALNAVVYLFREVVGREPGRGEI